MTRSKNKKWLSTPEQKSKKSRVLKEKSHSGLRKNSRGLSTVEYIILLVLIAAAGVATWNTFGGKLKTKLKSSTTEITNNLK